MYYVIHSLPTGLWHYLYHNAEFSHIPGLIPVLSLLLAVLTHCVRYNSLLLIAEVMKYGNGLLSRSEIRED